MKFLVQGNEIDLTPTEQLFLLCLSNDLDYIVPHDILMNTVWGTTFLQPSAVKQLVYRLRQKLPEDSIRSHRGFGYSLNQRITLTFG